MSLSQHGALKTYTNEDTLSTQLCTCQLHSRSFLNIVVVDDGQEAKAAEISHRCRNVSASILQHISVSRYETIKCCLVAGWFATASKLDELVVTGLRKRIRVFVHRRQVWAGNNDLKMT
ncbi:hypothetical protein RRF57_005166 [Xylaria bambusicola]|uniref:Uncharacterized protein n=1 Tax=Xylaria bambusicola TaxID=326684 RepID=A0AAN7Z944_9PEZI